MSTTDVFTADITTSTIDIPSGSDTTGLVIGLVILALIFATSVAAISCVGVVIVKRRKKDVTKHEHTDSGMKNSFANIVYDYTGGRPSKDQTCIVVHKL